MTTALELLDWAQDYCTYADDGFKAEMVWLACLSGNENHPCTRQNFMSPEWKAFAHAWLPELYDLPEFAPKGDTPYETEQRQAIKALLGLGEFSRVGDGALNEVTHQVIWASQFGKRKVVSVEALAKLKAWLKGDLTNDEYAKIILSLRLLGDNAKYERIDAILKLALTPETYHEQLCALVSNILRKL